MKSTKSSTTLQAACALFAISVALYAEGAVDTTNWTAAQDHQNMMDQLGIKALRPGPSGTETAPNHANYDEATANPYPDLPDVLTLKNGKKVKTAAEWTKQRWPEIVEDFDREVLGRVPKNAPKVNWEVVKTVESKVGGHPVMGKQLLGHVDNSSDPDIKVDIQMTLVVPADAKGPVPVMMMFGGRSLPELAFPPPPGRAGVPGLGGRGPLVAAAAAGAAPPPPPSARPAPPANADPPATEQLIADGWGFEHQSGQHSGRQWRRFDEGRHRTRQQRPAAQTR
jgi:hypothetical protein